MGLTVEWEIVRAGTWNGITLTTGDLDEMAETYDPAVHEAPLVLDHPSEADPAHRGPAYGWVESVRSVGDKLLARIKQVPEELRSIMESGRYKHRSIEFYRDFQGTGRKYLKRVALLGAAIPAVSGMDPLKFAEDGGPSDAFETEFEEKPKKEEQTMSETYTKKQVDDLIEAAVSKAEERVKAELTKSFGEQLEAKDEEVKSLTERAEKAESLSVEQEKRLVEVASQAAEKEVKAFCEKLVAEGKVTPAEAEDLQVTLLALPDDEASAIEFSEGEKENPRARFMKTYEAREKFSAVPMGEVAKPSAKDGPFVTFGEGDEEVRVEKGVVEFYESNRSDFEKMGVSLEAYARSEAHNAA
ncbi:GPO family capsid scaffolding protein [Nitrospinae bacterium AH_259_B05_G02_I21]|nr:GPO family capsid scaffolding protein [Nitrospinae bacterium AH_259_B05_G02_I21]